MESIVKYLDCGQVIKIKSQLCVDFKVGKLENILTKIIPFLQNYPLQSVKLIDFKDWVKAEAAVVRTDAEALGAPVKIKYILFLMRRSLGFYFNFK